MLFITSLAGIISPQLLPKVTYSGDRIIGIMTPIFFLFFGVGVMMFGKFLGKREEKKMLAFIEKTCDIKILDQKGMKVDI